MLEPATEPRGTQATITPKPQFLKRQQKRLLLNNWETRGFCGRKGYDLSESEVLQKTPPSLPPREAGWAPNRDILRRAEDKSPKNPGSSDNLLNPAGILGSLPYEGHGPLTVTGHGTERGQVEGQVSPRRVQSTSTFSVCQTHKLLRPRPRPGAGAQRRNESTGGQGGWVAR